MEMVKRILASAAISACAASASAAGDFSLSIGSPFAASGPDARAPAPKTKVAKDALFAVRLENCPALDQAQITGVALGGVLEGQRTSTPVVIDGTNGVYVVRATWTQLQGVWVVSLSANCGNAKAGALVPVGPLGFLRGKTKLLPRAATKAEIDAL